MNVAADRNWAHSAQTWRFLLELGTGWGMFDGDELAGTTVVTPYAGMSAISMVLVHSRYERQGIGGKLVSHALDSGVSCLYATKFGKPLYERLGFHSVGQATRYSGVWRGGDLNVARPAKETDLPDIIALDQATFGAERPEMWAKLLDSTWISDRGVIASTRNNDTQMIGPVIASSPMHALALIAQVADGDVRVHIDNNWLGHHLDVRGLTPGVSCDLMVRNADEVPGDRSRYFAPVSMALG
ncbi:acetyltransferase [Lentzea sp. NBRC 105346]|uniref:GNAT family N-acetyltransferase n=1 Tax=Lentzea sp. NBRC 105346 TaxID=3032205 RepID=UPI002553A391|nr:GNAT family N-acetyltransferase [Lentzea sp. NBRC 105346]GLZ33984.1 acetyltransferase [Lentzea sp. NBRC 105346]